MLSLAESLAAAGYAFLAWFAYELWYHRDGSAIGCYYRPDLDGPRGIPLLGNLLLMLREGEKQLEFWTHLRENQVDKTRPLSITIPGIRMIDCTTPDSIEWIQKSNFKSYMKGPIVSSILGSILGEGIFAVDGEKWLTIRKSTSKIFSASNFRGVIAHSIEEDLKTLETIIGRHADSGEEFDLAALFFGFTLSSFTKMAFSVDIGALSLNTNAAPVPFAAAFDFAQGGMSRRVFNPFWKFTELFSEDGRKMREAAKVLDDFAYGIIRQREADGLHTIVDGKALESEKKDLLSLYMELRDENGKPMSKVALRDSVINLIIAGRDTTAQALAWIYFHLLTNPEHLVTIRREVDELELVDYDSYKTLTHTLAVFNEGLRLHPSVPKNQWTAKDHDVLPNGTVVRPGELVRWGDFEMGRDEKVWGPDAKEYKPSRWIDEKGSLIKVDQWKLHCWNGGARLCLGQNLATFEATSVIAAITRNFDLKLAPDYLATTPMTNVPGVKTPQYQNSLTLPMDAPFRVVATRRLHV